MPAPRPFVPALALALVLAGCEAAPAGAGAPVTPAGAPVAASARFELAGRATLFGEPYAGAVVKVFALGGDVPLATGTADATGAFVLALGEVPAAGVVRMVAGGAGNMVAGGAGNMVAGGAGNMVAGGAGNMVAGGAGNMVAGGAGNMVAGGAGNMVAGGAGNFAGGPVLAAIGATAALVRPAGYRALLEAGASGLDEITTTSYVALAPGLMGLGPVTPDQAAGILAGYDAMATALGGLDVEARRRLIGDEILHGVDPSGNRPPGAGPLSPGLLASLGAVPGFTNAFQGASAALTAAGGPPPGGEPPGDPAPGTTVPAGTTPGTVAGTVPGATGLLPGGDAGTGGEGGSGGGDASGDETEPATLTLRVDLPGGPTLAPFRLLSLRTPGATVKATLSGPTAATATAAVGAADPLEIVFTGLAPGDGYALVVEGFGATGVRLARATRVLALGPDGLATRDDLGRVRDLATFSLNEGANAASVLLPLGGPSTKVTL